MPEGFHITHDNQSKKIYVGYRAKEKSSSALLEQLDWFYRAADFDPKTGLALPQALSSF